MRTSFSWEFCDAQNYRTLSAQLQPGQFALRPAFPLVVKHRQARVKIYRKSAKYPFYRIAYRAEGKRILRSFKTYREAKAEAKRVVRQLAAGMDSVARLSVREALAYKFAMGKLDELSVHLSERNFGRDALPVQVSLEDAIAEYVEAKRALGTTRLIHAVERYLELVNRLKRTSVRDAVNEYIAHRHQLTLPPRPGVRPSLSRKAAYQERLQLGRFAKAIQCDVCDLTKDHFELFFRVHLKSLTPKSRNHYRATLRQWIKFCVAKDYLSADHRLTESPAFNAEKADTGDIEIYTPAEFAALLNRAEGPLKVLIAIGGLAGLRTQELLRLDWADVWRCPGYIEVGKDKAKTRQRRLVPVVDSLAAWLAPWREYTQGLIWPGHEITFQQHFQRLAREAGVPRKRNGLRHSFISYRLAAIQNENQVAQEAGTSPPIIHSHYRELCTPEEAKAWFAVRPSEAEARLVLNAVDRKIRVSEA